MPALEADVDSGATASIDSAIGNSGLTVRRGLHRKGLADLGDLRVAASGPACA